jgi:hypothetical protein
VAGQLSHSLTKAGLRWSEWCPGVCHLTTISHLIVNTFSIRTFNGSKTACFPCAVALASTWDQDLMGDVGKEMAIQAKAKGVQYDYFLR